MNTKRIEPISQPLNAVVTPPGSKSITNRAFIIAALAQGESNLSGVLDSDDTRYMRQALQILGVDIQQDTAACTARIQGCGGTFPAKSGELFLGNSGTSIRFLTAAVIHSSGCFTLDGIERMRHRPIGDLVDALKQWGVDISYLNETGYPPIKVNGSRRGGKISVAGNISSQYLSALMMAAVGLENDTIIEVSGELVSLPYVTMTSAVMRAFGAEITQTGDAAFFVPAAQRYQGNQYVIEPDASAASYFFAAAAIASGKIRVQGLNRNALQGDIHFVDCLEKMGCQIEEDAYGITVERNGALHGIDIDMRNISDTAQTLGVTALFADSPTVIRNVANMRVKETDRISALCSQLRKFGALVEEYPDGLKIIPLPTARYRGARIEVFDDHRMAMSFALAGLKIPGVEIENPECTAKTFPDFFKVLESLR